MSGRFGFAVFAEQSLSEARERAASAFRNAGIETAETDSRVLLLAAAELEWADLIRAPERPLGAAASRFGDYVHRRLAREPVSRIIGKREFWGIEFEIDCGVLDPRPDSETLVEAGIELARRFNSPKFAVLDLGVGSGALLCALLSACPQARGLGVDLSEQACRIARKNVRRAGLSNRAEIERADWSRADFGRFDLVVSNPPYIPTGDIAKLDPEVARYDPALALDGGADGLDSYRSLAAVLSHLMSDDGAAAIEIGPGQSGAVAELMTSAGLAAFGLRADLAGRPRVVLFEQGLTGSNGGRPATKMDQR